MAMMCVWSVSAGDGYNYLPVARTDVSATASVALPLLVSLSLLLAAVAYVLPTHPSPETHSAASPDRTGQSHALRSGTTLPSGLR